MRTSPIVIRRCSLVFHRKSKLAIFEESTNNSTENRSRPENKIHETVVVYLNFVKIVDRDRDGPVELEQLEKIANQTFNDHSKLCSRE